MKINIWNIIKILYLLLRLKDKKVGDGILNKLEELAAE